ncbi:hypothetical protein JVT61DRAFT_11937 [Boletus reticuloceps]|uniref:Uncharacterized protein n=1 Tax=Boletus reticuloceps TaxID=495285 RepID=A0A8I2YYF1_9AGAM|nr:hypothetical protein JVT61DRAFT_11937 [Boletus reticuloceps]
MHRGFQISYVVEFIQQYDELPEEGKYKEDCKLALAWLARICRALGAALNVLCMHLDSLGYFDVLPSRTWAKKTCPFCRAFFHSSSLSPT